MTYTDYFFKINTESNHEVTRGEGFLAREVTARLSYMAKIPLSLVTTITDTAIGVILSVGYILKLRRDQRLSEKAFMYSYQSHRIISLASMLLIRIVNPSAKCELKSGGALTTRLVPPILELYNGHVLSDNFWKKHVCSRVIGASGTPIVVVARFVDAVFGAIALPIALVTLGKYKAINDFAINNLSVGGIIGDILLLVREAIRPTYA